MVAIIVVIMICIFLGGVLHYHTGGNNPANDDKFFRTARRVINHRSHVRRNTDRRGG